MYITRPFPENVQYVPCFRDAECCCLSPSLFVQLIHMTAALTIATIAPAAPAAWCGEVSRLLHSSSSAAEFASVQVWCRWVLECRRAGHKLRQKWENNVPSYTDQKLINHHTATWRINEYAMDKICFFYNYEIKKTNIFFIFFIIYNLWFLVI